MSDAKKKMMEEIDRRVARKKELQADIINRNIIEGFVLAFISNVDELQLMCNDAFDFQRMAYPAQATLLEQLRSYDHNCEIEISWHEAEGEHPQVNGVLIKWSPKYQKAMNCEPELFVDVTSLLLG